jgi:hypothetical protein
VSLVVAKWIYNASIRYLHTTLNFGARGGLRTAVECVTKVQLLHVLMVLLSHDVVHLRYVTTFFVSTTVRSEKAEVCVFCELADLHCAAAVELVADGDPCSHLRTPSPRYRSAIRARINRDHSVAVPALNLGSIFETGIHRGIFWIVAPTFILLLSHNTVYLQCITVFLLRFRYRAERRDGDVHLS